MPPWYGQRLLALADRGDARIGFSGVVDPHALDGLDPALLGRDQLPWLKESSQVISRAGDQLDDRPLSAPRSGRKLVYPELAEDESYERLWADLWHDPPARRGRPGRCLGEPHDGAEGLGGGAHRAPARPLELRGPGTELTIGLLPTARWLAGDFETRNGLRHLPNLPTEEVFTTPDPVRTEGHVTSTKPLVLEGRHDRPRPARSLRRGGRLSRSTRTRTPARCARRSAIDDGAARLGEVALVDRQGRIGPLGTVFYDTLLDENAASHIALGNGFGFAVERRAITTASTRAPSTSTS